MPVAIVCPACNAKLKAPDHLIGKAVKCPGCSKPVLVKAPSSPSLPAPAPAPAPKSAVRRPAPPPVEEPLEDVDPVQDELDAPPRRKGAAADNGDEAPAPAGGPSTDKERSTAMWIHLLPIVLGWCCGIGTWISLFLWISKKKDSAFIDHHGKTWLNWVINLFVVGFLFGIIAGVLQTIGGFLGSTVGMIVSGLVGLLAFALGVTILVMQVMVALKAKKGEWAEYKVLFKVLK